MHFQQQCNSLIFPDSLTNTQFGLSDHLDPHVSIDDISISSTTSSNNLQQPHPSLTLMGVSSGGHNIIQPVILHHTDTNHQDNEITQCSSSGDKSPLPELTQLSSHDFTRGINLYQRHESEISRIYFHIFKIIHSIKQPIPYTHK